MIVFEPTGEPGFYDLVVNGRAAEYDVETEDFLGALRRRRIDLRTDEVFVEDETGWQERLRP